MRTRSLETLHREAASSCRTRGHSMWWTKPAKYDNGQCQDAVCRLCGMDVRVKRIPMPNECLIMGDAVALECNYKLNEVVVRYGKNTLRRGPNGYMAEDSDGLTDWPVLRVDAYYCVWDHPERFPARFRALVSKYMLKHEKE